MWDTCSGTPGSATAAAKSNLPRVRCQPCSVAWLSRSGVQNSQSSRSVGSLDSAQKGLSTRLVTHRLPVVSSAHTSVGSATRKELS